MQERKWATNGHVLQRRRGMLVEIHRAREILRYLIIGVALLRPSISGRMERGDQLGEPWTTADRKSTRIREVQEELRNTTQDRRERALVHEWNKGDAETVSSGPGPPFSSVQLLFANRVVPRRCNLQPSRVDVTIAYHPPRHYIPPVRPCDGARASAEHRRW
jgi:hypothetical protein